MHLCLMSSALALATVSQKYTLSASSVVHVWLIRAKLTVYNHVQLPTQSTDQ